MNLTDLKIYGINFGAFAISLADIDVILKLTLLAVSIGYTVQKWYLLNGKNK